MGISGEGKRKMKTHEKEKTNNKKMVKIILIY